MNTTCLLLSTAHQKESRLLLFVCSNIEEKKKQYRTWYEVGLCTNSINIYTSLMKNADGIHEACEWRTVNGMAIVECAGVDLSNSNGRIIFFFFYLLVVLVCLLMAKKSMAKHTASLSTLYHRSNLTESINLLYFHPVDFTRI